MNIRQLDSKYHIELEANSEFHDPIETIVAQNDIRATIRKTSNDTDIPDDEPTITFRGRDRLVIPLLLKYLELSKEDNCTQYHIDGVVALIRRFDTFKQSNPEVMKQPGITKGL